MRRHRNSAPTLMTTPRARRPSLDRGRTNASGPQRGGTKESVDGSRSVERRRRGSLEAVLPPRHSARTLSDGDDRKLSFVDATVSQIRAAIQTADPSWNFNAIFWRTVLVEELSDDFKPLMNRTLTYWVEVFDKWQELRRARRSTDLNFKLNGNEIQKVLFLSKGNLQRILKLFDPDGEKRLKMEGYTEAMLDRVRVPMLELIAAGILSSKLISTKHKLIFLFELVDKDDDRMVDEEQLAFFIKAFVRGVGMMFNVPEDILPRQADSHRVAQRLYDRIHRVAAEKGTEADRAREATREGIPAATMIAWCYGGLSEEDPLALPYRLAIERFCPGRTAKSDITDEFDDSLNEFRLSHSEPTASLFLEMLPAKTPAGTKILSRAEVILARDLYRYAMDSGIMRVGDRTFDKFIKVRGDMISPSKRQWYMDALSALSDDMSPTDLTASGSIAKPDFFAYLRKLSPKALPKHLRMYEVWCMEYDQLQKDEEQLVTMDSVADEFMKNSQKPMLPVDELEILKNQFAELDLMKDGFLDPRELQSGWGWSDDQLLSTFSTFDVGSDGLLDEDEFLRMMCPAEYRLPEMAGFAREMFGKLLTEAQRSRRSLVKKTTDRFEARDSDERVKAPASLLPIVPDDLMQQWNDVFDGLDHDDDDTVRVRELECSGLLSTVVCYFIASLIDPSDPTGFSRESFLDAMCKAHGYQRPLLLREERIEEMSSAQVAAKDCEKDDDSSFLQKFSC